MIIQYINTSRMIGSIDSRLGVLKIYLIILIECTLSFLHCQTFAFPFSPSNRKYNCGQEFHSFDNLLDFYEQIFTQKLVSEKNNFSFNEKYISGQDKKTVQFSKIPNKRITTWGCSRMKEKQGQKLNELLKQQMWANLDRFWRSTFFLGFSMSL